MQADGKIVSGGIFTSIGGQTRNGIARLDATTGSTHSFNPNANSIVCSIAVQADGKILAGGFFTTIGGVRAIVSPGWMLLPEWQIRSTRTRAITVFAIAVQADGNILAGGVFHGASSIGGQPRHRIARLIHHRTG